MKNTRKSQVGTIAESKVDNELKKKSRGKWNKSTSISRGESVSDISQEK